LKHILKEGFGLGHLEAFDGVSYFSHVLEVDTKV